MFDVYCETCKKQRLLDPAHVRHLINDEQGIVVIFDCYCGTMGALRTGAAHHELVLAS